MSPAVAPEARTLKSIVQPSGSQLGRCIISSAVLRRAAERGVGSAEPSPGTYMEIGSAAITTPGANSGFSGIGDSVAAAESVRPGSI